MPYQKREQQIFRQFRIIKRLYALEELQGSLIAQEYAVSSRTVLRDMGKIGTVIPLINKNGVWSLDTNALTATTTQLNQTLLSSFAHNMQIELSCLDKTDLSKDKVGFAIEYSGLPKNLGELIVQSLEKELRCSFRYAKSKESSQREVDPIKLYTENGLWYLIARDHKDDRVKSFHLSKIEAFKQLDLPTTLTSDMWREADEMKSVWSSADKENYLVKLYIKPNIAHYFTEIKLHKTQEVEDRHHDGGLEVHCHITHKLEILPAIKSWLPHVYILEPIWLREELVKDLEYYDDEMKNMDILMS